MVCVKDVARLEHERPTTTSVAQIMTPLERLAVVGPEDDALQALSLLVQRGVNQLPVVEGARLRGLLAREQLLSWLALHEEPAASGMRLSQQSG